ncbi:hypothetical protein Drorol1_Dr00000973 [Drosera rotundifolia]
MFSISTVLKLLINGGGERLIPPLHRSSTPHWYSSSRIISPQKLNLAVDYLTNSLGLSPDQAISTAHKLRRFKSKKNFNLVLDFFKRSGFNDALINSIVSSFPGVLWMSVVKTLEPRIRVLEGLGLTPDLMIKFVSSPSWFLKQSLKSCILPVIETMRSILGSDENVARALQRFVSKIRFLSPKSLRDNVELLRSRGMSYEEIKKLMLMYPRLYSLKTSSLEALIGRVEGKLGIRVNMNMFRQGLHALSSMSAEKLDAKFGALRSCGWDDSNILILVRTGPLVLTKSELALKSAVGYYMKELGYHPKFIASHPALLSYSMEKRVRPRNAVLQVLKDKNLIKESFVLYTSLSISESEFLRRFVEPFKESVPDIYEVYKNYLRIPSKADG